MNVQYASAGWDIQIDGKEAWVAEEWNIFCTHTHTHTHTQFRM